ncbi:MAG: xanthine dehydrogenase family protein molybdopterin-binding subunit, partial [Gammaproteobacteria bacterium]
MGANEFAKLPHIGESLRRKEDVRFLTGAGNYTDDVDQANQKYAVFVRSPHAHARVKGVDTAAAAAMPGVAGVFSGKDIEGKMGGLPCGWLISNPDGSPMKEPPHPILAIGKVRYVGDHVAMVVADTLQQAKDAAEAVQVDYEELAPVIDMRTARNGPALHDEAPDNHCYKWTLGDKAAVDAAFAGAAHVTKLDITNNRLIPNAIEPRAANASYNRATDEYVLYVANQNPHVERLLMTAFVLQLPEHKVRVVAPDVGGGFGSKIFLYAEDVALTWAAKQLNCAIKWTAERSESFVSDAHGRDHITHAEMAMDKDGKFLAMRVHTDANLGAYLSTFASSVPTILYGTLLAGQYAAPQIYVEVDGWFTSTAPVDAYRGAGRPEATYVVERLVTRCAWELGLSQDEIRKRNFITQFPYQTPVALQYDIGDYHACMNDAQKLADVAGFDARRQASEAKGLKRGIGYSSYIEACGLAPSNIAGALGARAGLFEAGEVRVHPTGSVTVFTGSHSHGQGHETTFAQLVAARLGIDPSQVDIVHGDTGRVPFGMGTYGSRSISVGGAAIMKALDKIETKAKKIAAHLLEASDADIDFANGEFTVRGTDKKVTFGQV